MKIAKNIWLRFKKWVTKFKFVKSLENGIKKHKAQCVYICSYAINMLLAIFVEYKVINNMGISDLWLTWIKEFMNLLLMWMTWGAICRVFDEQPSSVIKKKCSSGFRAEGLGLMVFLELIFSAFEKFKLGRAFLLITCIIIFVQLRRDKKRKNDKDNEYNEVTRNLKEFGPPAIEIIVVFIVRLAEIVAEILTTCSDGSLLKPEGISSFVFILTVSLYVKIGGQLAFNCLFHDEFSPGLQQTISLGFYILADFIAFLCSMIVNPKLGYDTAINLFFSFCLVLITWFCYFCYCGWFLNREGKSLDYEFWTLLFESVVKACIAFAVIENELQRTDGVGIHFTIWLSIINSLVITLYPMIDMYKFVRESLKTTPSK